MTSTWERGCASRAGHDARTHADGTLSVFDDEGDPPEAKQSRGLVLAVDDGARVVSERTQYFHPGKHLLAGSQGSTQYLPGGDVFIGWAAEPYYTEFQQDGTLVLDGRFSTGSSYRAFLLWLDRDANRPTHRGHDEQERPDDPVCIVERVDRDRSLAASRGHADRGNLQPVAGV